MNGSITQLTALGEQNYYFNNPNSNTHSIQATKNEEKNEDIINIVSKKEVKHDIAEQIP